MVPYMDAVDAVTVMCVLLFVLHVCILKECKGAMMTEILVWGPGAMSAGCEYMDGTRGSGFVSFADDVLGMSVVCGVIAGGGACEMCICFARGGVGGMGV